MHGVLRMCGRMDGDFHLLIQRPYRRHTLTVLTCLSHHCLQEEGDPTVPISLRGNRLESLVILLTVPLQILGQIEHGLRQYALLEQEQWNQNAANPAIAILEGMQQFKLRVHHCRLQKKIHVIAVHILLPCLKMVGQQHRVGWYKTGLINGATVLANPVLVFAKLTRCLVLTTHTIHQNAMQFSHKTQAYRVVLQMLPPGVKGLPVVENLLNVLVFFTFLQKSCLLLQHLIHRGLRPFNPGRQYRFPRGQRRKHDGRIGNSLQQTVVTRQGSIGLSYERQQSLCVQSGQWQFVRDIGIHVAPFQMHLISVVGDNSLKICSTLILTALSLNPASRKTTRRAWCLASSFTKVSSIPPWASKQAASALLSTKNTSLPWMVRLAMGNARSTPQSSMTWNSRSSGVRSGLMLSMNSSRVSLFRVSGA